MATPAQFYDQNGELRLDGSLVGGGGAQTLLSATRTLTSAEILALHDTRLVIVAAQANTVLVPTGLVVRLHFGTTPYAADATDWVSLYIGLTGTDRISGVQGLLQFTQNAVDFELPNVSDVEFDVDIVGLPLALGNQVGNPTLGNSTVTVTVPYFAVPVT